MASCSKQTQSPVIQPEDGSMKKIQAVQNLSDVTAQRMAFSLFTPDEKVLFWKEHIASFVRENNLNQEQLQLINEISSKVTPRLYTDKKFASIFKVTVIDPWLVKASKTFDNTEIFQIGFNPGRDLTNLSKIKSNFVTRDCKCAVGSKFTCYKVTVGYPPSITYGKCSNVKHNCNILNGGCGFAGASDCDGDHCDNTDTDA